MKFAASTPLRVASKPVGRPWPVNDLRAYDLPKEVGWGDLLHEVLKSRGWKVKPPCHIPTPSEDDDSRLVFVKEFEACVRGQTPEEAFGKQNAVQEGYRLQALPRPKHALWMMNWSQYRVPGTCAGRAMPNREDFHKVVINHGRELPGDNGNYRIAGIPGMEAALCKDRISEAFRDEPWYPIAYVLPKERSTLLKRLTSPSAASEYWIAKPRNECAGAGIAVWNGGDPKLQKIVKDSKDQKCSVVQSYLADPLLLGGYKFHMRVHLVITNTNPLQAYVQRGGQCLFATKPYTMAKDTLGSNFDPPVHVTNMGLNATPENKDNYLRSKPVIGRGQQILVRELESILQSDPKFDLADFWQQIVHIAAKTARYICNAPSVKRHGKLVSERHFEVLGLDLMVDKAYDVYMCEANDSPGLCHPDEDILGSPNPDYGKEIRANVQTWHDILALLGLDAARPQNRGSVHNWYDLDFSQI